MNHTQVIAQCNQYNVTVASTLSKIERNNRYMRGQVMGIFKDIRTLLIKNKEINGRIDKNTIVGLLNGYTVLHATLETIAAISPRCGTSIPQITNALIETRSELRLMLH